ncbi:MAG: hypothetical protein HY744_03845 [Deltaproteobacteria bacterium]|nr:hypothetical protein [Deltaproteobacteria bacterium]
MKGRFFSVLFLLLCLTFTGLALYNVYSDNAAVLRLAEEAACGSQGKQCSARMSRMERTPFSQTFEIATPKRTVDVRCVRAFYMVGEYSCKVE